MYTVMWLVIVYCNSMSPNKQVKYII